MPARQPWEEPPAAGWSSHLGGLGLEFLAVIAALAAAVGTWRAVTLALQPVASPASPDINWGRIFFWCVAVVLCTSVVVIVWRRLGGLALVGAMLTDHGRVARFGGRPPIWLDDPPESGLRVIHLSDLHVTEGDRVRMVEHASPGGNVALRALLRRPELGEADIVVFTGDITDRGTAGSWGEFLKLIGEAGLLDRAVLVPGNHDLALVDPWAGCGSGGRWRRNDRFGIVQLANLMKFGQAFAATGGGRRGLVMGKDGPVPFEIAWVEVERAVKPFIESLPRTPVPRLRFGRGFWRSRHDVREYEAAIVRARKQLLGLFPIAVPYPQQDAVMFVLNSCTPTSRHPATNGLGWVGRAQSRRLSRLARAFQQPLKLVALHHHVVRRAEEQGHDS